MPKQARYKLVARGERSGRYELFEQGALLYTFQHEEDADWFRWLDEHISFSFRGLQGTVTFLKEARVRGSAYWYAYRSQDRRTVKRYAGKTSDLTFARLEALAKSLIENAIHEQPRTEPAAPLLNAKFLPPHLPSPLIDRESLLQKLDAILTSRLTLITAPAGFGKTTIICQWIQRSPGLPVAWLSLDTDDNDPLRFWRYLITALQTFHPAVGKGALASLSPFEMPSFEAILTLLLNEITCFACSGVLILEDYHRITSPLIQKTMGFFLEHLPASLHIVIVSRSEPPLALASFRARGELCELHDLRFSRQEIAAFLHQIPISEEGLRLVETRLEGWAAGLRLLVLWFQKGGDVERLVRFAGDQSPFLDYFVSEVLLKQSVEQQDFLLRTSMLASLTGSLCDAITGRHDSKHFLEELACTGLFLEKLGQPEYRPPLLERREISERWYRYHPLFAEAMQAEARRRLGLEEQRALLRKASDWYEQQGMLVEAIETAFQAQDIDHAADMIARILDRLLHHFVDPWVLQQVDGGRTLCRWLERLPEEMARTRQIFSLGYVVALLLVFVIAPVSSQGLENQGLENRDFLPQKFAGQDLISQAPVTQQLATRELVTESPITQGLIIQNPGLHEYRRQNSVTQEIITPGGKRFPNLQALRIEIEETLQRAEAGFRATGDTLNLGRALALHALFSREYGALEQAIKYAEHALACFSEREPESELAWQNLSLNIIGKGKLAYGFLREAQEIFLKLYAVCEAQGNRAMLRAQAVLLHETIYEQGKLRQVAEMSWRLLVEAREENDSDDIAHALLFLARLAYEWNDTAAAEKQAQEALHLALRLENEEFQVQAELILAWIEQARGENERAQHRCTWLLARIPMNSPLRLRLGREIEMWLARFSLLAGNHVIVEQWRQKHRPDLPRTLYEEEALLAARLLLVKGQSEEALALLSRLANEAQRMERARVLLAIQAVQVQALYVHGELEKAKEVTRALLEQAQAERYLRLFLDEGDVLLTLVRALLPQLQQRALVSYARTILEAAQNAGRTVHNLLIEPLSPQEERVLRLLLKGYTNPAIANELIISINTVKAHLKSLYRKLNVSNRTQACEAAHRLDLL
ncbi:regulatory LuxR family protein [Thermosporothrix hazakensis]|jgi:LuxR family maltose regulon positive regulatory protein|uniref:Regulatory LuxR family protein n=1 Tax=Thermosporothrix hazakensis TaxID=644383 RepID=A0A326UAU1_THEHA|nr:LuxR C-terminal-related transcriptional regulator [Thermosporothrix hazakensis]PZW32788.1 regulatory LuxR family protein [Thermosporothrix hazakensis]GCE50143.1 hypothetical protein KTH_50120 [Thermosporothrix hazakensis]